MDKAFLWVVLIIILVVGLIFFYRKTFKKINEPSVCLITGGVKCGKSLLSVKLATKNYIKRWIIWWFLTKILRKKKEEPMFYTNCFVSFGKLWKKLDKNIMKVTLDLMLRNYRYNYGSVIYINEASLLADSQDFNNKERNVQLSLLNKLIGHETKGGALYYDTQSVLDSHYSIKRVMSTYLFIQKNLNFFFFRVLFVREMINQENGINTFQNDVDESVKLVFVPRWYYKRYDRYEFSYLTDDLPVQNLPYDRKNKELVSFNPLYIELGDRKKKGEQK